MSLALSGRPEAAEVLPSLRKHNQQTSRRKGEFQAQVGDLVSEALKENERITAKQGLESCYRERSR